MRLLELFFIRQPSELQEQRKMIFTINCLVNKMSENSDKCPSQVQGDVFGFLLVSNQQSKTQLNWFKINVINTITIIKENSVKNP